MSVAPSVRRVAVTLLVVVPLLLVVALVTVAAQALEQAAAPVVPTDPEVLKWGFAAAAVVTGMSAIGAAYAVAVVGGAAMGAVAEKPETAGRALVFVGLAEGIAIYGLIIAIMILGRL